MRWLNEVELAQGGANGPTIKLRAAIAALPHHAAPETAEARAKRLPGMQGAPEWSMGFTLPANDPPRLDWSDAAPETPAPAAPERQVRELTDAEIAGLFEQLSANMMGAPFIKASRQTFPSLVRVIEAALAAPRESTS